MSRRITSRKELLFEKEQLKQTLELQKDKIRVDVELMKEEFRPAMNVLSNVEEFFSADRLNPLISTLIGVGTSGMFSKSNSIVKFLAPKALGSITSRLITGVAHILRRNGKKHDELPNPPADNLSIQ